MAHSSSRIVIVGAGITGLCCAHRLMALGADPLLVEASSRVGGRIRTLRAGGLEFEAGPNTLLDNSEGLIALIDELGLRGEVVPASAAAKKRYILLDGRLEPLPMGLVSALTSPLLGVPGIIGLLGDLFHRRPPRVADGESVASFVRRHFGNRVLDRLVGPFLSGVYAGDPERLEVASVLPILSEAEASKGSVIRGMIHRRKMARKASGKKPPRPQGITFRGGLERLPARLAEALGDRLRLDAPVESIRAHDTGCDVRLRDGSVLPADHVVIATETAIAATLTRDLPGGAAVARDLLAIPSADVAVVGLAYPRANVRHPLDGFGYLVGPGNAGPMLGCLFRSSIFPASAPANTALLACFLGGATRRIDGETDARLSEIAQSEVAARLGVSGRPSNVFVIRWPQALPQANLGHGKLRARIEAWSHATRVSIISSGVHGVPLPKCIETARAEARRLAAAHTRSSTPSD